MTIQPAIFNCKSVCKWALANGFSAFRKLFFEIRCPTKSRLDFQWHDRDDGFALDFPCMYANNIRCCSHSTYSANELRANNFHFPRFQLRKEIDDNRVTALFWICNGFLQGFASPFTRS